MKAEDFIELIEQNRFDKISKNGMTLIAERFRELQRKQLSIHDVVVTSCCKGTGFIDLPNGEDCYCCCEKGNEQRRQQYY